MNSPMRARRRIQVAGAAVLAVGLTLLGVGAAPAFADAPAANEVIGGPENPRDFVEYGGDLYFIAYETSTTNPIVWSFDGTSFTPLADSPDGVIEITAYDGNLVISGFNSGATDYQLYSFDGTSVTAPSSQTFTHPQHFVEVGGDLYFTGVISATSKVWKFDGTTFTSLVGTYTDPTLLSAFASKLYFRSDGATHVLFVSDPSAATAAAVPGSPSFPTALADVDGTGYVGDGTSMYSFDGTTFTNVTALAPRTNPNAFTAFDGDVYFIATDGANAHLYKYDGTDVTLVPGTTTQAPWLFVFDGKLFFPNLFGAASQTTLGVLDAGTVSEVTGAAPLPSDFATYAGNLYFSSRPGPEDVGSIWTVLPADVPPTNPPHLAATGAAPLDVTPFLLAGIGLLGLGAVLLFGRRARRI